MSAPNAVVLRAMQFYTIVFAKGALPMHKRDEQKLYQALGDEFTTKQFEQTAKALGIPIKTAQRYLGDMISRHQMIIRISQGNYVKKKQGNH